MSHLNSLLASAADDTFEAPEAEYHSIIAVCIITPWTCSACKADGESLDYWITAIRRGQTQRVGLSGGIDLVAFFSQYPAAIKRHEFREPESFPFCSCVLANAT